jgi:hydrogenase/urease accessory protein HupE
MMASLGASIVLSLFLVISLRYCTKITVLVCCIIALLSILAIGIYAYLYTKGKTYFFIPFVLSTVSVKAL